MISFTKGAVTLGFMSVLLVSSWAAVAESSAKIVTQLVPDQVATGKEFSAVIQIKNIGDTTWSAANEYALATITTQPWDSYRVEFGGSIAPGQILTIKPKLTAPMAPGEYALQWQMRRGDLLFGEKTVPVKVSVTGSLIPLSYSEFVFQNTPVSMRPGENYTVSLQFKNTGETVWTSGQYQLVSATDDDLLWTVDMVDMMVDSTVLPGGFQTFSFDVQAPLERGVYPFQWRMQHKQMGRFGAMSQRLNIEVK